ERFDAYALTSRPEWQALLGAWPAPSRYGAAAAVQPHRAVPLPVRAADPAAIVPKLDLSGALEREYGRHRSGWAYAMRSLMPLHRDGGVWVDAFPEHTFERTDAAQVHPHRRPWIGFLHNPPNMPDWFVSSQSPHSLLASD